MIERYCQIAAALRALLERFLTVPDCVDTAFVADQTLDQLPVGPQVANTRVGGVDLNKPPTRAVLQTVLALAASPAGFTAAQVAAKVQVMTRGTTPPARPPTTFKKLRGKDLLVKLDGTRRYHIPPQAIRTITALVVLRDQVIAPILAGVRVPRHGRKPNH